MESVIPLNGSVSIGPYFLLLTTNYNLLYLPVPPSLVPTSRSDLTPLPRRGMTTAQVQTTMDGLHYSWDPQGSGVAFPGLPYGLNFVDPTPIATQVVSADALEGAFIL